MNFDIRTNIQPQNTFKAGVFTPAFFVSKILRFVEFVKSHYSASYAQ
ncbi:MAG TPA: hypothetical protein PLP27_01890 [Crocinitomicaceae bacterium]|nr:hypothetical protein [Crocinitomicaceae bacterium]